ncbi:hypothetical protein GS500_23410 [Rhodococcus hoagii]|nr:hypothetical protein [Prescottella equi]
MGDKTDVEDPLLSAHRLAKFYVIASGDALLSCCDLVGRDFPMHIGSGALARVTAENASKAMFMADPAISWKARVLRAHALFVGALSEYKSSNEPGARALIDSWQRWRSRTSSMFTDVPRQTAGNSRKLIEDHFDAPLAYDELSRPTHGNAVWLTLAVIQEQKRTNYTWCATLRNMQFAIDVTLAASRRLCELWDLDAAEVLAASNARLGRPGQGLGWDELLGACDFARTNVDFLSRNVVVDSSEDSQPVR